MAGEPEAVSLFVVTSGNGFPLVLVHGLGSSSGDWEYQVPALSQRHFVIAPDLRGYGRSPRVGPYTVQTFAADLWSLLERLGVHQFDLLGYSMGGAVAMQMAVDRPSAVHHLILSNTLPSFRVDSLGRKAMFVYRYAMMSLFGPPKLSRVIAAKMFPDPDQAELRRRVSERNAKNDRSVYLQTIRALVRWSVVDRLDQLTMPTLLIGVEHDYFPREELEGFYARLPNARMHVFQGSRHGVALATPDPYNTLVLDFLEGRGPGALNRPPASKDPP